MPVPPDRPSACLPLLQHFSRYRGDWVSPATFVTMLVLQLVMLLTSRLPHTHAATGAVAWWVPYIRNLLGFQCTVAYVRILYYLAFSNFKGLWLWRALQQIFSEIGAFLCILFVAMLGFSVRLELPREASNCF